MAGDTANPLMEVNTVVKIRKISQSMHSGPDNRAPCAEAFSYGGKKGTLSPDMGMAMHAGFGGWDPSKSAYFHRGVTIAAINTQSTNVVLVTELYRLLARYTLFSGVA
jgi:hypothetical protein